MEACISNAGLYYLLLRPNLNLRHPPCARSSALNNAPARTFRAESVRGCIPGLRTRGGSATGSCLISR